MRIIEGRRYCGAKAKHGGMCRALPLAGRRRCRFHGGNNYGARDPHRRPAPGPWVWDARAAAQAIYRRLGIPWHGGRPVGSGRRISKHKAMARMAKALEIGRAVLEVIPPAEGEDVRARLQNGMRAALELQCTTVELVQGELGKRKAKIDIGMWRLGCETSNAMFKNGIRLLEQDFQARKLDRLGELLERIAAAKKPE